LVTSAKSGLNCENASTNPRPDHPCHAGTFRNPRSKRFLTTEDVADIVRRYEVCETTQQVGERYGISKTRVANVLREQGVAIRRQGLNDRQVSEAAMLYAAGRSLAWLGARYDVSHTTVATALRRRGFQLRRRLGWSRSSEPAANRLRPNSWWHSQLAVSGRSAPRCQELWPRLEMQ
jgi:hypothetical protein